jgi:hypothetical protein
LELIISISSKFALELIGHWVTALNESESVKLASMKLLVGIQPGGQVSKLRESPT